MFNQSRLQPRRIQPAFAGVVPSQPVVNVDADRAPVTFGWWLYADGRFLGNCHLETLYRLDRVDARLGDHSAVSPLEPSEHYGHTTEELRELLHGRQQALLPRVPAGHRWIGPQLVQELPCMVVHTRIGAGKLHGRERNLPRDRKARLEFAHELACRILGERIAA